MNKIGENKSENINLYGSGLPFTRPLDLNLQDLFDRVHKKGKASLIIIDGGVGEGKTTLSVEIADYLNSLGGKPAVDLIKGEQIGMGANEFAKALKLCYLNGHLVVIYDEAGDFHKRGALTRLNAMLNRIFDTFRGFKVIVLICLPDFAVLDEDLFRKKIPRLLLHCYGREGYGNFKAYSLYCMKLLRQKMRELKEMNDYAYELIEPNFEGHFKDLNPERILQLDKLSTGGKLKELDLVAVKMDGLLSFYQIADKLALSVSWVRKAIASLGIKPKTRVAKVSYFEPNVVNLLTEYDAELSQSRSKNETVKPIVIRKFKKKVQGKANVFTQETGDDKLDT